MTRAVEEWSEGSEQSNQRGRDIAMAHITNSLIDVDDFTNEMVNYAPNTLSQIGQNI